MRLSGGLKERADGNGFMANGKEAGGWEWIYCNGKEEWADGDVFVSNWNGMMI